MLRIPIASRLHSFQGLDFLFDSMPYFYEPFYFYNIFIIGGGGWRGVVMVGGAAALRLKP